MGGEDRLGSLTSFSVPVFRSFRSCPGFKQASLDISSKLYKNSHLPCRCGCGIKQQLPQCARADLALKAEVALLVAP